MSVCAIDHHTTVHVDPPPTGSSVPSVEFLRLFFNSPIEEAFAIRCAQFLAKIVGDRVALLRPDTTWSEISEWSGPSIPHAALLALALRKEFGVEPKEVLANPEFTTFRDFVEYVCVRESKAD